MRRLKNLYVELRLAKPSMLGKPVSRLIMFLFLKTCSIALLKRTKMSLGNFILNSLTILIAVKLSIHVKPIVYRAI